MKHRSPPIMRMLTVSLAVLGLAACGSKSDAQTEAATGDATPAATTASEGTLSLGADGVPRFREGLWEVTRIEDGEREVSKVCTGAEAREDVREMLTREAPGCKMDRSSGPGGIKLRAVCDQGGVKTETDMTMSGSSTNWNMKLALFVVMPDGARSGNEVTMNARWVGACPAGMKPGDEVED
jgi:Protein of unknown function (DUF3617).